MSESTYHQIHFAWAEPTLLGRVGPGPAASSLTESGRPSLRSWRDRLVPALTVDYRSALPGTDPADLPETLWARSYADGQAALVYRWPGDVRDAHAWAVVGPAHGLTLPRILSLHENPNTRPAARRPPVPGWGSMPTLEMPTPWELTAAPGAVRTRDRRAAETTVQGEAVLAGAVASALHAPERPIRIALEPGQADLWQATQIRVLWGMHRILHDVLTPARAIPAAGWQWSFSTYDPDLATEGQHLAFGPPRPGADGPYLRTPAPEYRRVAERLVEVLRDEGGDALADHLRERGVPDAPTFGDRRALLADWLAPGGAGAAVPDGEAAAETGSAEGGAVGTASVEERVLHPAEAAPVGSSASGTGSTGAVADGEAETRRRPVDPGNPADAGADEADETDEFDARDVPGWSGPAVGPIPYAGGRVGGREEPVEAPGPDKGGNEPRQHGGTSPAPASPSASGVREERLPGADGTDGADIPEAEPLPSDDAAPAGAAEGTGTSFPATAPGPEYERGRPGSGNTSDERLRGSEDLVGSGTASAPSEGEPSHGGGAPPERIDAPEPEGAPLAEADTSWTAADPGHARDEPTRTRAVPEPGHDHPGGGGLGGGSAPAEGGDEASFPRSAEPPEGSRGMGSVLGEGGPESASPASAVSSHGPDRGEGSVRAENEQWATTPAPAAPFGNSDVGDGSDRAEGADAGGEPSGSDLPRPHAHPRSVAGAHPSFRLNRPQEEDAGDPLPEVEDLDAPASVHEVRASVEPDRGAHARAVPGDTEAGGLVQETEDARSRDRAPRRSPGASPPLFGERRPGFAPPAEHSVFGAPEPHDPPSRPTGEPPPLHLRRTPEPGLHPRTPDDRIPAPDPAELPEPAETSEPSGPEPGRSDAGTMRVRSGPRRHAEEAFGGPARDEPAEAEDTYDTDEDGALHGRSPAQAPPLMVAPDGVPAPDYAAETEPETDPDFDDSGANWPTQYADLPLARLERWHAKRGPEGAHTDVVDARAAVRAERSELQRVRDERDHYHAEVQDLRREVARLDRPFLDGDDGPVASGGRRWPARLLAAVLLVAFLATGLEAGARFGVGALDVLSALPFVP